MKTRKLTAILLAVLLSLTTFIIPMTATALSSSPITSTISTTFTLGGSFDDSGNIQTSSNSYAYTNEYIDVSTYDDISIVNSSETTYSPTYKIYWYDSTKTFVSKENPTALSKTAKKWKVKGDYLRVHFYSSSAITQDMMDAFQVTGINSVDPSLIDASKTGSLKIYKYEMDDTSAAIVRGTGYDTDSSSVPAGALPLQGVTFRITKFNDLTSTYYTSAGTEIPTAAQAKTIINGLSNPYTTTKTTDINGYAIFNNLPLGLYLVEEIDAPSQVTAPVDDFVISVPFTSADNREWKYDVTVFPKNKTDYSEITIKKIDGTTNSSLNGAKFTLYHFTGSTYSASSNAWESVETNITTANNGTATPTNPLAYNAYYRLTETQAPTDYILDGGALNTDFYINSNGEVCNPSTQAVINNNDKKAVTVKNYKPAVQKYIDKSRGADLQHLVETASLTYTNDDNNYHYYTIKVTTPNIQSNLSTLKTFKVTDHISNSAVVPTVTKVQKADGTVLDSSAYTFEATTTSTAWNKAYDTTLTFDTSKLTKNTDYYISYKCFIVGASMTQNRCHLIYSLVTSGTDTTSDLPSAFVKFIPYEYKFTKTTSDGTTPLKGAKFQVFESLEDAKALKNPIIGYDWKSTDPKTTKESLSDGILYFNGFDCGDTETGSKDFYLVEVEAPSGYNLLAEPIRIKVTPTSGNSSQITVKNSMKIYMPFTGGEGRLMFVIVGVLFLGCGVATFVFIIKRRKNMCK